MDPSILQATVDDDLPDLERAIQALAKVLPDEDQPGDDASGEDPPIENPPADTPSQA